MKYYFEVEDKLLIACNMSPITQNFSIRASSVIFKSTPNAKLKVYSKFVVYEQWLYFINLITDKQRILMIIIVNTIFAARNSSPCAIWLATSNFSTSWRLASLLLESLWAPLMFLRNLCRSPPSMYSMTIHGWPAGSRNVCHVTKHRCETAGGQSTTQSKTAGFTHYTIE